MVLQEILFGTYTPPNTPSRIHRIGFSSLDKYTAPTKRIYASSRNVKDPNNLMGSRKLIYNILKRQTEHKTANEICHLMNYTRNHCSIVMADLYRMGMLERIKINANGTRFYTYKVKDND